MLVLSRGAAQQLLFERIEAFRERRILLLQGSHLRRGLLLKRRILCFQGCHLRILFCAQLFDGIDEGDIDAVILDAFNLPFVVCRHQQRLDFRDLFGNKPKSCSPPTFQL